MYICSLARIKLINKKRSTLCMENGSSTCKASFEECYGCLFIKQYWIFV